MRVKNALTMATASVVAGGILLFASPAATAATAITASRSAEATHGASASAPSVWWTEGYYMFHYECVQSGTAWVAMGARSYACDQAGPANYPWRLRILD
ncbi:hypothetical protein ACFY3V_33780 [Streptosporangium sp. NPDC000095]|uniref:hypothetical protein n=1 Tax=Streptosporangium sp. NPDC000095 TaxID=3366184 RepID=UPI0036801B0A